MRRVLVLLLLATIGASGGGCVTSIDSVASQGATGDPGTGGSTGGGSTAGGGGTDPSSGLAGSTSGTGGPNAVTLTSGDTALAFAATGRSPTTGGLARLTFANQGTSGETATVSIDPRNTLGWSGPTELGLYHHDSKGLKDADLQTSAAEYRAADYSEYRKINTQTDEELQYWKFTDANGNMTSDAAQYRNVTKGGTKDAEAAWFFGGNATPAGPCPPRGRAPPTRALSPAPPRPTTGSSPTAGIMTRTAHGGCGATQRSLPTSPPPRSTAHSPPPIGRNMRAPTWSRSRPAVATAWCSTIRTSFSKALSTATRFRARPICSATKAARARPQSSPIS